MGEIFVSYKYDRKLMFKVYNEFKKINIKRTNNLIYKELRKGTNTCQDINNGKKEKQSSTILTIKKIQIKTISGFQILLFVRAKSKNGIL